MFSVILPAYVPESLVEMTRTCLDSLKATADPHELIIVDNGSCSGAREMMGLRASQFLRYEQPIGYGRAANIGLAVAKHDWLCVINTDLQWCSDGWLEQFQTDYRETEGGVLSAMDDGREGIVYDESWFSCWFTHRDVIRKVGYFDESMPFRFHDQDYAIRVHRAGLRVMRTGNVPVSHVNMATYSLMSPVDDPVEAQLMRDRWGAVTFGEWLGRNENLAGLGANTPAV